MKDKRESKRKRQGLPSTFLSSGSLIPRSRPSRRPPPQPPSSANRRRQTQAHTNNYKPASSSASVSDVNTHQQKYCYFFCPVLQRNATHRNAAQDSALLSPTHPLPHPLHPLTPFAVDRKQTAEHLPDPEPPFVLDANTHTRPLGAKNNHLTHALH